MQPLEAGQNINFLQVEDAGAFRLDGQVAAVLPLMIGVEWLMKNGLFSWWEEHVPDWVNRIFPAELMLSLIHI